MSEEAKREKFVIEVNEPFEFEAIAETKYITSGDFCSKVCELFRNVFADFEGCTFNAEGSEPTISLYFNHGEYGEDATVACSKSQSKSVGSTILDRSRDRDRQLRDGDRYYLTDDGKDVVKDLLINSKLQGGNPNFGNIVSDVGEGGNIYYPYSRTQYTRVAFISLPKLCGLLFGSKDEEGNSVDYQVITAPGFNPVYNNKYIPQEPNYMLNIIRVSAKELAELCNKLGFSGSGINMIRA